MTEEQSFKIACLGWGSLCWDKRSLPTSGEWKTDGPTLPIEFGRVSTKSKIVTLVVASDGTKVPVLWTLMTSKDLETAKSDLAFREEVDNLKYGIGWCETKTGNTNGECSDVVMAWAKENKIDIVVWTNLKSGMDDANRTRAKPKLDDITSYLEKLPDDQKADALNYIMKAPEQIKTEYRQALTDALTKPETKIAE